MVSSIIDCFSFSNEKYLDVVEGSVVVVVVVEEVVDEVVVDSVVEVDEEVDEVGSVVVVVDAREYLL